MQVSAFLAKKTPIRKTDQHSEEGFSLCRRGFVTIFPLLCFATTCFRCTPQDEGFGGSVVVVTGGFLCPRENFHHWVISEDTDASLVLEFFTMRCYAFS